jgi:hypothetical protein
MALPHRTAGAGVFASKTNSGSSAKSCPRKTAPRCSHPAMVGLGARESRGPMGINGGPCALADAPFSGGSTRMISQSERRIASIMVKPAAFGQSGRGFSRLHLVSAGAPAIGRSFHAWPQALPGIRPLLAVPAQLLFLFLESRFGAVTHLFNVGVQCGYSIRANPLTCLRIGCRTNRGSRGARREFV